MTEPELVPHLVPESVPESAPELVPAHETLGSLGEAEVLRRIFPRLPDAEVALIGPGDDAAVLAAPDGRYVVTTDTMVHGPDFRLEWSTPHDLGWKAAVSNLADVAAMGARPTALVVAVAAPPDTPVSTLEGLADGLRDACAELAPGCGVVGGDLSASATLVIAVTAFGDLEGRDAVLRSGARDGDIVAVSGSLGLAAEGLALLFERAVDSEGAPDAVRAHALREEYPEAVGAQLAPQSPLADGIAAALAGATSMLDISDGLAIDARRIADASGVAIDLDSASIKYAASIRDCASINDSASISTAAGFTATSASHNSSPDRLAISLSGGEDHALLATFPAHAADAMPNSHFALPGGFRRIGTVRIGSGLKVDGRDYGARGGWDPYQDWSDAL